MFDKHRFQTLTVAFFNLCYVFYIVFVNRIKCCIVPPIIVQMELPVGALIPPKQDSFARLAANHKQSVVEANLPTEHFEERMFIISSSIDQLI